MPDALSTYAVVVDDPTSAPNMAARPSIEKVRRASPRPTRAASLPTTIPAFRKPRKARNAPMPAVMANYRPSGMARTMARRAPIMLRITNSTPEMKTAPSAVCQGYPRAPTT